MSFMPKIFSHMKVTVYVHLSLSLSLSLSHSTLPCTFRTTRKHSISAPQFAYQKEIVRYTQVFYHSLTRTGSFEHTQSVGALNPVYSSLTFHKRAAASSLLAPTPATVSVQWKKYFPPTPSSSGAVAT